MKNLCCSMILVFLLIGCGGSSGGGGSSSNITPQTPQDPGYSRSDPADIGSVLTYTYLDHFMYGDFTFRTTLYQVIRGEEAWTLIEDANMFNDPPHDGHEYILADIKFDYLAGSTDYQLIVNEYYFTAVSSSGVDYENPLIVCPDPEFGADMYEGGSTQGWAAFEVGIDDVQPLLTYGRDPYGRGGVWYKLY